MLTKDDFEKLSFELIIYKTDHDTLIRSFAEWYENNEVAIHHNDTSVESITNDEFDEIAWLREFLDEVLD